MNDSTPILLDRLDQAPVAPAPLGDLLAAGRAAKRRQRRVVIGGAAAATLLVLGGGVAVQWLSTGSGGTVSPVDDAPAAESLTVRITNDLPSFANRPIGEPLSGGVQAVWDTDAHTLTYISNMGYSGSCPPTGAATIDPEGTVDLRIDATTGSPGFGCTADAQRVAAVINNVPGVPANLSVTDGGVTREVPFVFVGPRLIDTPVDAAPVGQPPTRAELVGTWRPLNLLGEDVRRIRELNGNRNVISFYEGSVGLAWTAYEGCNWTSGTARLSGSGELVTTSGITTARGCIGSGADLAIANSAVIERADNARLDGDVLRFYMSTGELLGEYVRAAPGA